MPRRDPVPPMRPRDVMFSGATEAPSAPPAPDYQKTSVYLRPDQIAMLDARRAAHRAAGQRTTSASDLMRTALDLAEKHRDEWNELVVEAAEAR